MNRKEPGRFRHRVLRPNPAGAAEAEIEHHLAELVDSLQSKGMSKDAALQEAVARFGDPVAYRGRLARMESSMRSSRRRRSEWNLVGSSLVQTGRTLRRSPGFAAGVIL